MCSGIARLDTKEMASLSVERGSPDDSIVVAVFETPKTPQAVDAWLQRECEYRFLAVNTESLDGGLSERLSVRAVWKTLATTFGLPKIYPNPSILSRHTAQSA